MLQINNTLPASVVVTTSAALANRELPNVTLRLLVKINAGKNSKQSQCFFS
jgi:hypothetical protein